jgi:phage terminase large subunit
VTTSARSKAETTRKGRPKAETVEAVLAREFLRAATEAGALDPEFSWPSPLYRDSPYKFAREILGVDLWDKQIEILNAIRDYSRVAVCGGRKVGKDFVLAVMALWYYCTFDEANVVITATTSRQIDDILWKQIRMLVVRSGRCVECKKVDPQGPTPCPHSHVIDGEMGELARTGLKHRSSFRSITGFTANEAEAVSGISGRNLFYIFDEASGIEDFIYEAVKGNLAAAGNTKMALISNPTDNTGEFFRAFHDRRHLYKTIEVSSLDSPNVITGEDLWPGLASRAWVELMKEDWGEDSRDFIVHVLGRFATLEEEKIISIDRLKASNLLWSQMADPEDNRLHIGLDPAGPGLQGDETGFAIRRGRKVLAVHSERGLTEEAILVRLLMYAAEFKMPGDMIPVIIVDRDGNIGASMYGLLRQQADASPSPFKVIGVRGSEKAFRDPKIYDHVRDELWVSLGKWIRDGGALPPDGKLSKELNCPKFYQSKQTGRMKVTSKDDMRKLLGHSPDKADATTLCVWQGRGETFDDVPDTNKPLPTHPQTQNVYNTGAVFDPYRGLDAFTPRR